MSDIPDEELVDRWAERLYARDVRRVMLPDPWTSIHITSERREHYREMARSFLAEDRAAGWWIARWGPIESAPKCQEVIVYVSEIGVPLIAQYTSLDALLSASEIESSELSEDALFEDDWFAGLESYRLTDDGDPTLWMPLPTPPPALKTEGD